jgi:hypothetical protein
MPEPMLSAADLVDETATVMVRTSQGALPVTYRPYALTPRMEMAMAKAESDEAFYRLFCEIVADLDLAGPLYDTLDRDDDGQPRQIVAAGERIPVTPEAVGCLPSRLLERIMEAIRADLAGGDPKANGRNSRNSSFARS